MTNEKEECLLEGSAKRREDTITDTVRACARVCACPVPALPESS